MDKPRFIVDSNVLIDTLNRRVNLPAFLDTLPESELYINPIIWAETLAKPGMTESHEAEARSLLSWFLRAELDQPTLEEAVRIRRTGGLKLPDAFIAAHAIILNATVLSNDPHLRDFRREGYRALPVVTLG